MKKQDKKSHYNFNANINQTFSQVLFLQTFLPLLNTTPNWPNNF